MEARDSCVGCGGVDGGDYWGWRVESENLRTADCYKISFDAWGDSAVHRVLSQCGRNFRGRHADRLRSEQAVVSPVHVGARSPPDPRDPALAVRVESCLFAGWKVDRLYYFGGPDDQKNCSDGRSSRDSMFHWGDGAFGYELGRGRNPIWTT